MSLTNRSAQAILNALFGKTSNFGELESAPTIYIGLSSTTPTESGGNVTEPSGGGYARVATDADDWEDATNADPSVMANAETIVFPTATANWASGSNLTYFVAYDASTSGNVLFYGALTLAKPVLEDDTAEFPAGSLTLSLD